MEKLAAFWDLFRKGNEVANVEKWKSGQISANAIAIVLTSVVAVAKAFGYTPPISDGDIVAIAGGLLALTNVIITVVSSSRAGLLPAKVQPDPLPTLDSDGNKPTDWKSVAERDFNAERG